MGRPLTSLLLAAASSGSTMWACRPASRPTRRTSCGSGSSAPRQVAPLSLLPPSSPGALAGAALVGGVPMQLMARNVLEVAQQANQPALGAFSPSFSLANIVLDGCERLLPDDVHIRATGRLYISMTKIADRTNLLVHEFASKRELMEALQASSFIPFVSGWRPPRFKGDLVFDGGYSDNLPVFDAFTITVSPFAGDASICPVDDCQIGSLLNLRIPHGPANSSNSFTLTKGNSMKLINAVVPPNVEGMEQLCSQGYTDAMRFLTNGHYIRCRRCREPVGSPAEAGPLAEAVKPEASAEHKDWGREQVEECADCEAARQEVATESLPADIREVFREAATGESLHRKGARPGVARHVLGLLIHGVATPLRVGVSLATLSGPDIETCPFGPRVRALSG